jgi:hypothetical protein
MKTHLDLRPVHHRREDRIRAHVLLCWLALLLIRIAENQMPTLTWRRIREQLETVHVGEFHGNAGRVQQRTELTTDQRGILRALQVPEPPRFLHLTSRPALAAGPRRLAGGTAAGTTRKRSRLRLRRSTSTSCLPRSVSCGTRAWRPSGCDGPQTAHAVRLSLCRSAVLRAEGNRAPPASPPDRLDRGLMVGAASRPEGGARRLLTVRRTVTCAVRVQDGGESDGSVGARIAALAAQRFLGGPGLRCWLLVDEGVRDPRLLAAGTLAVAVSTLVHEASGLPGRRLHAAASARQREPAAQR